MKFNEKEMFAEFFDTLLTLKNNKKTNSNDINIELVKISGWKLINLH